MKEPEKVDCLMVEERTSLEVDKIERLSDKECNNIFDINIIKTKAKRPGYMPNTLEEPDSFSSIRQDSS